MHILMQYVYGAGGGWGGRIKGRGEGERVEEGGGRERVGAAVALDKQ